MANKPRFLDLVRERIQLFNFPSKLNTKTLYKSYIKIRI